MGRTYTYIVIAITIMLVMTFVGLPNGFATTAGLVGFSFDNSTGQIENVSVDISDSDVYDSLFNLTAGILILIGGAIAIGYLTKSPIENIILLEFLVAVLALFVSTFGQIMNSVITGTSPMWLVALIITIFLPITVGLIISLAEWFRGTDN